MGNQELIEMAARASDIKGEWRRDGDRVCGIELQHANGTSTLWNPLDNDAHAFALAVTLGIAVFPPKDDDLEATAEGADWWESCEVRGGDRRAATRWAIVGVAARMA